MKEKLPDGHIVEVPSLGLFKLIANASTSDNPNDAGETAVQKIRINFLACTDLKKQVEY